MTDKEHCKLIRETMDDGDEWIAEHVSWLLNKLEECDAEIKNLREAIMATNEILSDEVKKRDGRIFRLESALRHMSAMTESYMYPYNYDLAAEWVRKVVKGALE